MNIHNCIVISLLLCFTKEAYSQSNYTDTNYISSDYYLNVAEAKRLLKHGDKEKAYQYLQKAEYSCELLNQPLYYEMESFVELSLLYEKYDKAIVYIDKLISNYGYSLKDFTIFEDFKKLKRIPNFDSIKQVFLEKEKLFTPDLELLAILDTLIERDQFYRSLPLLNEDSVDNWSNKICYTAQNPHPYAHLFDSIDRSNYLQLMRIIEKKGFPLDKSKKYTLQQRDRCYVNLMVLIVHFNDSAQIANLESIIWQQIKQGNCPPDILGTWVDRRCSRKLFIYGMYNITPEFIYDYKNVDERRKQIGLPPIKTQHELESF